MGCADEGALWAAAERGPSSELQAHLDGCERCQSGLLAVRQTRAVLEGARHAQAPRVDWARADANVLGAAKAHLGRPRWRLFPGGGLALAGGLAAAALAVLVLWVPAPRVEEEGAQRPLLPARVASLSRVESAAHAHVTEAEQQEEALLAGYGLHEGARIRTTEEGSALLRLPEGSRALLRAGSQVTVRTARAEDVALSLQSGELVVEAAHVPRDGFVVEAGHVQVTVVGTVFRVRREEAQVEVSVADGRVRVAADGTEHVVSAGERLVLRGDRKPQVKSALVPEDGTAYAALGLEVEVEVEVEVEAPAPERVVTAPTPTPAPKQPRPAGPKPGAGDGAKAGRTPAQEGTKPTQDWATPQFQRSGQGAAAATGPNLAERAKQSGLPITAEGLFLQRAQESLKDGACGNFLLGLSDVVESSEDQVARERARILRARCYDERLEPLEAAAEYRRYLSEFPYGRFAGEARRAVAD